jgi:hypothetical protein
VRFKFGGMDMFICLMFCLDFKFVGKNFLSVFLFSVSVTVDSIAHSTGLERTMFFFFFFFVFFFFYFFLKKKKFNNNFFK